MHTKRRHLVRFTILFSAVGILLVPYAVGRLNLFAGPLPAPQEDGQATDYEVVKLLTRLFGLVKDNYMETLELGRRVSQTQDGQERVRLLQELKERIVFVEAKGEEYLDLMPGLQESYPGLEAIIASFSKDVDRINQDLGRIREENHLSPVFAEAPDPQASEDAPHSESDSGTLARPPRRRPSMSRMGMDEEGPMTFPITLEVRSDGGEPVKGRRVIFKMEPIPRAVGMAGLLDEQNQVVDSHVVYTGREGRANVMMRIQHYVPRMQIRRIIVPDNTRTVCRIRIETGTEADRIRAGAADDDSRSTGL